MREHVHRGVVLRAYWPRAGKTSALNRTIPQARGEIVVLCDANAMFVPDAINRLVGHFADPEVGAVTGDVRPDLLNRGTTLSSDRLLLLRVDWYDTSQRSLARRHRSSLLLLLVNGAVWIGSLRELVGSQSVTWKKADR